MDNEYILGPDGELCHWGIKGMKWGVRRYQNKDGSLTPRGKKRYAQEEAKLKEREKTIKNQERTKAKLAKLDSKKAELDAREKALAGNKKDTDDNDTPAPKPAQPKTTRDMSDNELQQKVNRLRNEEVYRDLNKKLGYDTPQTEMDARIADLERQKKYLELQRDINNLTPKKVSRGKKLMDTLVSKVVEPAVTDAGKAMLSKYLKETGLGMVNDLLQDQAKKAADKAAKESKKEAEREAKERAAKEAADKAAKEKREKDMRDYEEFQEAYKKSLEPDSSERYRNRGGGREYVNPNENRGLVLYDSGIDGLSKRQSSSGRQYATQHYNWDEYVEVDSNNRPVSSSNNSFNSSNVDSGRRYLNGLGIAGLLPAPKDDD